MKIMFERAKSPPGMGLKRTPRAAANSRSAPGSDGARIDHRVNFLGLIYLLPHGKRRFDGVIGAAKIPVFGGIPGED